MTDDRELQDFERELRAFRPRAPGALRARGGTWFRLAALGGLAAVVAIGAHFVLREDDSPLVQPRRDGTKDRPREARREAPADVSLAVLRTSVGNDAELAAALDRAAGRLLKPVGGEKARVR